MKKNKITFSRSGIANAQKIEQEIISKTFAKIFAAEGVAHNENNNTYSLNDIENISEEEMMEIYSNKEAIDKLHLPQVLHSCKARTLVACRKEVGTRFKKQPLNGFQSFAESDLEVLRFGEEQTLDATDSKDLLPVDGLEGTFKGCYVLRIIYPMDVSKVEEIGDDTFKNCNSLQELRLYGLKTSVDLSSSPRLSYRSLLYIMENKEMDAEIELSVNSATYRYLYSSKTPDSNIGGTTDEWSALRENAILKNVKFDCPACVAYVKEDVLHINKGEIEEGTLIFDKQHCIVANNALSFL